MKWYLRAHHDVIFEYTQKGKSQLKEFSGRRICCSVPDTDPQRTDTSCIHPERRAATHISSSLARAPTNALMRGIHRAVSTRETRAPHTSPARAVRRSTWWCYTTTSNATRFSSKGSRKSCTSPVPNFNAFSLRWKYESVWGTKIELWISMGSPGRRERGLSSAQMLGEEISPLQTVRKKRDAKKKKSNINWIKEKQL